MRTFTALFTLLLALLFTSQALAGPVLEVGILDMLILSLMLTYHTRLVRTRAALLQPHLRLLALLRTTLLRIHRVVFLLVLEPAHLAQARVLRVRTAILAPVVVLQDMVGLIDCWVRLVLIDPSCFWKCVEHDLLRCYSLRAVRCMVIRELKRGDNRCSSVRRELSS